MLCTVWSIALDLPVPAPAPAAWRFDFVSALIGAVVALVLAWLVYRSREALRQRGETMVAPLLRLSDRLEATAEDRYRELVATYARSLFMPAHVPSLDTVFIEPELFLPPPPPQPASEADLLATRAIALPVDQLMGEHPQLVFLGPLGSGKTTLLAHIALACTRTGENGSRSRETLGLAEDRLPVCVPLPAIDWSKSGDTQDENDVQVETNGKDDSDTQDIESVERTGKESDGDDENKGKREINGVDLLIRTAVKTIQAGRAMERIVREGLHAGQATVLIDGWDELRYPQRQRVAAWLSELVEALPGTIWLVGAEPRGYGPLTEIGFVPLRLNPWNARKVERFAAQWAEVLPPADAASQTSQKTVRQLGTVLQDAARGGYSPLELALLAYVFLSSGEAPSKRSALFDRTLDLYLGTDEKAPWLPEACRTALEEIAMTLQQERRTAASRDEIDAAVEGALPVIHELPVRAPNWVFRALTGERGVLRPIGTDRYAFHHPLWQAFLAAQEQVTADPATLIEHLDDGHWTEMLRFYAESGDMKPVLIEWMRRPDDLFHSRLCTLGSWIGAAPADASWRDGAMAMMARSFLQPDLPARVREGLIQALIATKMPGITYLFKQALRHTDPDIRRIAVTGLTKIANDTDLPALEAALGDHDEAVREATVRGLPHLGTDAATRLLAQVMLEADEKLSITASEALAQCGAEAADFLREAMGLEDMLARRAAVYGLARLRARDALEKAEREDDQWIVRSAAVAAMEQLDAQDKIVGVPPPVEVHQLPWLISWAATKGERLGVGEAARQMLRRALKEGDGPTRAMAAQTLAQVGRPDDVESLLALLPDEDVVDAALEALAQISDRYDLRLEI
jgi:HEAT repeat protein/energy-coupling factor transporter ATP-binding protein EcfA2